MNTDVDNGFSFVTVKIIVILTFIKCSSLNFFTAVKEFFSLLFVFMTHNVYISGKIRHISALWGENQAPCHWRSSSTLSTWTSCSYSHLYIWAYLTKILGFGLFSSPANTMVLLMTSSLLDVCVQSVRFRTQAMVVPQPAHFIGLLYSSQRTSTEWNWFIAESMSDSATIGDVSVLNRLASYLLLVDQTADKPASWWQTGSILF